MWRPGALPLSLGVLLVAVPAACQAPASTDGPARIDAALASPDFTWRTSFSENFRIHYLAEALTSTGVRNIGLELEDSLARNLELLGSSDDPEPMRALVVSSREEMAAVVGRPYGGLALPSERAVVFVTTPDGHAASTHELMHLVAYEVWGPPAEPRQWISEGLATFAPRQCAGFELSSLAALMAASDDLPSLDTLVNDFYGVSDLFTYLAGAAFVQFLHAEYGTSAIRALWTRGLNGGADELGTTAAALEQSWRHDVSSVTPAPAGAWDHILSVGCEGPG